MGLKHYETRSWKTSYRGKLLICSAAKLTKEQYQQYLKICNEVKLPAWDETNFPRGCAIAICDLVDCIEMTPCFIEQQSKTEILCGDWQPGRYAWKLENIQPIREPFAVKGKQGLFNISQDIFQSQQELTELLGDNQINPSNDEVLGDIENSPSKNISPSNQSPSKLLG
ncbi:ASCH domain-containing protein, partial [Aetokthonos hydrillicola CCALA 1050]|nr:ASCH domain-containing protein [Aetokthonos hydrillicola CCALA 1050]